MDRATYLTMSAYRLLDDWGANLCRTFPGQVPYLVGSALTRADHRDVDVRLMLWDDAWAVLDSAIHIPDLNLAISLWGQQVTGLPVDFQVQRASEANDEHHGRRQPLGLRLTPAAAGSPETGEQP